MSRNTSKRYAAIKRSVGRLMHVKNKDARVQNINWEYG
jgi:hypothetical protein